MERLTFEGNFCDIAQCVGEPGNTSECPGGYCDQRRTWERLKEYEDTGLTPEQVAAQKWIPVTERLPEENTAVLTYRESGIQVEFRWHKGWDNDEFTPCQVTHWMHLPEKPKEV